MRSPAVLASAALLVLTLACQDQPTSPDVAPLFAPGGNPGPPADLAHAIEPVPRWVPWGPPQAAAHPLHSPPARPW